MKGEIISAVAISASLLALAVPASGAAPAEPEAVVESSAAVSSFPSNTDLKAQEDLNEAENEATRRWFGKEGAAAIFALAGGLDGTDPESKDRELNNLRSITIKTKDLFGDQVAAELGKRIRLEKDSRIRLQIISVLRSLPGKMSTLELEWIARHDPDKWARRSATHFVSDTSVDKEENRAFFQAKTSDKDVVVRLAAYIQLAELGDPSGRNLALSVLKGNFTDIYKIEAVDLIGTIANPADRDLLVAIMQKRSLLAAHAVPAYMRLELRQLPIEQRLKSLLKSLDDPSPDVRYWAYCELARSEDSRTNSSLRTYLHEKGHIGYKEAADTLSVR